MDIKDIQNIDFDVTRINRKKCNKLNDKENTETEKVKNEIFEKGIIMNGVELFEKCIARWRRLSIGCKEIDDVLNGGFPKTGITQIAGESSCGKTQICLQLSLTVQYPESLGGFNAGAIYICTEDAFPAKRLAELCEHFTTNLPPSLKINFSDNIFVEHVFDTKQLYDCLNIRLPNLLSTRKIGLIIIDSIAGIFRYEYETDQYIERAKDIYDVARKLQSISYEHDIAVICVNQVTTQITNGNGETIPALGVAWSRHLTTLIELKRDRNGPRRSFHIIGAPDLSKASCDFMISPNGITSCDSTCYL